MRKSAVLLMLTIMYSTWSSTAHAQLGNVIHRERSLYREIYVTQQGDERCMLFRVKRGVGRETCKSISRPEYHVFPYTRMMMAGLFLNPRPRRVLIIGLGGGTISTTLQRLVPNAIIDNVELDPSVVNIAKRYFGFRTSSRVRVSVDDGRVFIKRRMRSSVKYDMVMLDAFDGDYIPEHLLTREFLREVRAVLTPQGIVVSNTYSEGRLYPHESQTYRSVFGSFYNLKDGNRVIISKLGHQLSRADMQRNAMELASEFSRIGASSPGLLKLMSTKVDWNTKAAVLTDQYSPSNILQSSN